MTDAAIDDASEVSSHDSRQTVSAIRRALLRGAFFSVVLIPVGLLLIAFTEKNVFQGVLEVVLVLGAMSVLGFVATPVAWVELVAARRPPTRQRDALALAATFVVAFASLTVAFFEVAYLAGALEAGPGGGLKGLAEAWHELTHHADRFSGVLAVGTLPFLPAALGRIRGHTLGRQLVVGATTCGFVTLILMETVRLASDRPGARLLTASLLMASLGAVLPVCYRFADAIESRIMARLWPPAASHHVAGS
ncbi:MAG TPA: hypothetical protein VFF73_35970 [Planctomycetota bacterium]|nr:hypothetical protein [Planctomycetota bacterium]